MPATPDNEPPSDNWHPAFAVWRWHWTVWLPMLLMAVLIGWPVLIGVCAGLFVLLRDIAR